MNDDTRAIVDDGLAEHVGARLTKVLAVLEIRPSSWYHRRKAERQRPGPKPRAVPADVEEAVLLMSKANPWYGYKRIAVMCRRAGRLPLSQETVAILGRDAASCRHVVIS